MSAEARSRGLYARVFRILQHPQNEEPFGHSTPKNNQHTNAPTTLIERPQAIKRLNNFLRSSLAAALAMHKAPRVDSGETSTRWAPTLIDEAIAMGFPP